MRRLSKMRSAVVLPCELILSLLVAVAGGRPADAGGLSWQFPGGNAQRGPTLMQQYGCVNCHSVPGVRNANGNVGAPLTRFVDRTYIAGMLRNTPDNLVRWLRKPQSVVPGNEQDARDMAAYLYTLRVMPWDLELNLAGISLVIIETSLIHDKSNTPCALSLSKGH